MALSGDQFFRASTEPVRKIFSGIKDTLVGRSTVRLNLHTTEDSCCLNIECNSNGRSATATATSGRAAGGQSIGAPAGVGSAIAGSESSKSRSVAPGQVDGTSGRTRALVELLRESAVGWGVLGIDSNETISECLDGGGKSRVSGRRAGVGACGDTGAELLEEGKGGGGDVERALGLPDVQCIVQLLRDTEYCEVPWITVVVAILRVAADGNGSRRADAAVDTVDRAESVDIDLEVSESLVGAGLESRGIASCGRIEGMNGGENGVGILARTSSTGVCGDVAASRVPVRLK